jgi:hypothetical protein
MPLILGTNSIKDTGYDVANSCRFESGDTAYLTRTCGSTASSYTVSMWVKTANSSGTATSALWWNASNSKLNWELNDHGQFYYYDSGTPRTTGYYRDVSAWYHVVFKVSSNTGTLYINGAAAAGLTGIGSIASLVSGNSLQIGGDNGGSTFDGYMSEVCFIDGTALNPDQFGEFDEDSGIWKPIDVSGLTFGTNGFYLDFQDSSALGNDVSGNNNDLTANNLTATDQSTDTCTNNFATLNPLVPYSSATFSEGNLKIVSQTYASIVSTIAVSKGKWYAEMRSTDISAGTAFMGITSNLPTASNYEAYNQSGEIVGYGVAGNGSAYGNGGGFGSWGGWDNNAIIMMAVDLDNNKLYWGVDGTWGNSSNPSTNTNGGSITSASSTAQGVYWFFCNSQTGDNATLEYNFGSPPYAISSGNADGNGYGNFEFAVPSSYYSLCTKNLSEYG